MPLVFVKAEIAGDALASFNENGEELPPPVVDTVSAAELPDNSKGA